MVTFITVTIELHIKKQTSCAHNLILLYIQLLAVFIPTGALSDERNLIASHILTKYMLNMKWQEKM